MGPLCDFATTMFCERLGEGARPEALCQRRVAAKPAENAYDTKRDPLLFGTIAAVLRARLSPMPVPGGGGVAKFGPIAAPHPRPAIREYFEKPWVLSGV